MIKKTLLVLTVFSLLLVFPGTAFAQTYSFSLDQETVDIFLNSDGTVDIEYVFVFTNDSWADPMDFIDIGMPTPQYSLNNVFADVNGHPVASVEDSPYVQYGFAIDLGANAIRPGSTGRVQVYVEGVSGMFFDDSTDENYTSVQFSPTWFDSQFVHGSTDLRVTIHLVPGIDPNEPKWHSAPSGFPVEPETGVDKEGRFVYSWHSVSANPSTQYMFGASVPRSYISSGAIQRPPQPGVTERLGIDTDVLIPFFFCGGIGLFMVFIIAVAISADRRRKLKYLPPKISIGGHGIKRGLTAVEAAILLEQPMDKIMTMILFGVLKKEAASVISRDPLKLEIESPLPGNLRRYEQNFLAAFTEDKSAARRRELQDMMIKLVKSVSKKMKGFSRRETTKYYQDIMERAWNQVEAADTPEIQSQLFEEALEWTMLDRDYDEHTRRVFQNRPIYVPMWWHRYDPGYSGPSPAPARTTASRPSAPSGRGISMPTLPGSDFAASIVNGVQNFSAGVIGSLSSFTNGITKVTNPPPPPSSRGGFSSGGSSCACACAGCACACACAGGGR
jgi:hypothetical protein